MGKPQEKAGQNKHEKPAQHGKKKAEKKAENKGKTNSDVSNKHATGWEWEKEPARLGTSNEKKAETSTHDTFNKRYANIRKQAKKIQKMKPGSKKEAELRKLKSEAMKILSNNPKERSSEMKEM